MHEFVHEKNCSILYFEITDFITRVKTNVYKHIHIIVLFFGLAALIENE